jgi:hypothetical protein
MKTKTLPGRKLKNFNIIAGLVHLSQALVMLLILNYEFKIPVVTRFFDQTSEGIRPVTEVLFNAPIAMVAPIFLIISAAFHLFIASPLYVRRYEKNITKGINPLRWWEYAFSSSIMLTAILIMGGLNELPSVVFVFSLNLIMNLMGLVMELYNQGKSKISWLPYNIGVFAGIVPWIIGGLYFWVSTTNIADSIPWFAKLGFVLTFLFFNSFAVNMWLQYKKIGKWSDYSYGERFYVVLSLVSKSSLGWLIVLGTLGQTAS